MKPSKLESGLGLYFLVVKCTRNQAEILESLLIDFKGTKLNQFRDAFFNVTRKAQHLTGSNAPASVMRDLKASEYFCG